MSHVDAQTETMKEHFNNTKEKLDKSMEEVVNKNKSQIIKIKDV